MRLGLGAIGATALGICSFAISVWGMDERVVASFPWATPIVTVLPIVAVLSLVVALAFLFIDLVTNVVLAVLSSSVMIGRNIGSASVREEDLASICRIADKHIGGTTNLADTTKLYRHNKDAFRKVVDTRNNRILGYFCVLPLTKRGLERVHQRNLLEAPIEYACFARTFRHGPVAYIGGIAGEGLRGRGGAFGQLKHFILTKRIVEAYARPMTDDGLKLAKSNGFKPVDTNDTMSKGVYVFKVRDL